MSRQARAKTRQHNFRLPEDVAEIFEGAAKAARLSLTTWVMVVGLRAAGHNELGEQLERAAEPPRKRPVKTKRRR